MTYLTIFLFNHLLNPQGTGALRSTASSYMSKKTSHSYTPLLLLLAIPMLLAGYVATTRYSDYRHHGVDIVIGSLLGVGTAALGWVFSGSRSINRLRGFRCCSKAVGDGICGGDPEAGSAQQYHEVENGQPSPDGEGQTEFLGEPGDVRRQQGVESAGDPKGALQLREVSLSFSSLDGPEASTKKKSTEIPSQNRTEDIEEGEAAGGNSRARTLTPEAA